MTRLIIATFCLACVSPLLLAWWEQRQARLRWQQDRRIAQMTRERIEELERRDEQL